MNGVNDRDGRGGGGRRRETICPNSVDRNVHELKTSHLLLRMKNTCNMKWASPPLYNYVMKSPKPSFSIFIYCKQSKIGARGVLGMRLEMVVLCLEMKRR